MTVKDLFCGLARAGGKALNGIGAAASEVLRHAEFQSAEDENQQNPLSLEEFYRNSPRGDGEYPSDPNGIHNSSR